MGNLRCRLSVGLMVLLFVCQGAVGQVDGRRGRLMSGAERAGWVDQGAAAKIAELEKETLAGSLMKLARERDYQMMFGVSEQPHHWMMRMVKNRRFIKVLNEVSELREWERAQLLSMYLRIYVKNLEVILVANPNLGYWYVGLVDQSPFSGFSEGDVSGYRGTRHAIHALALVGALTGTDLMWPELERMFEEVGVGDMETHGYKRTAFKGLTWGELEGKFVLPRIRAMAEQLNGDPELKLEGKDVELDWRVQVVFPQHVRAQLKYLMVTRGDEEGVKAVGLDKAAVLGVLEESETEVWRFPDWREHVRADTIQLRYQRGLLWDYEFPYTDITVIGSSRKHKRDVYQLIDEPRR